MPTLTDITDEELGAWKGVCKTPSDKALMQIAFNLAHIYDMLKAIKEDTMCYGDYFESVCTTLSEMQEFNPYKPMLMKNCDMGYHAPEEYGHEAKDDASSSDLDKT